MTVKISGMFRDGIGESARNCTIVLKARRTSSTMMASTMASENPDETRCYSTGVEYGQYGVTLLIEDFPPSYVGTTTVYEGSRPGTLNDFLDAMMKDDVMPETLRRSELMVNEVTRHTGASLRSATTAKKLGTAITSSKNATEISETNAINSAQVVAVPQTTSASSTTVAKKSETSAKNNRTVAKASGKNIKSSQTATKTSETNAKDSEASTKVSETAATSSAKASAVSQTVVKASEDAAREYVGRVTEPYRYVLQPLSSVWVPSNGSLDMITGYSLGYKRMKIGDNVVQVVSDKQVNFSRVSTATYINKFGKLETAEINEPRFKCDSLFVEGQKVNFFPDNTDPPRWDKPTSLDVIGTGTDSFGFNYGRFVVQDSIADTGKAHTTIGLYSNTRGVGISGDEKHVTISCWAENEVGNITVRVLFGRYDGKVKTSIGAANPNLITHIISKIGQISRVTAGSVKNDATGQIFFGAILKIGTIENTVGSFTQYSPDTGQMVASGNYPSVVTSQVEASTDTSSFIVMGTILIARASDIITVPIKNSLYDLPSMVLCEVHKNWYKTPDVAPRVFDTDGHRTGAEIAMGFGSSGGYDGSPYCGIGDLNRRVNKDAGLERIFIGMRVKSERSAYVVSNDKLSSEIKTRWEYIRSTITVRIGGQTTARLRHLFGHMRNSHL